jgi:hypothetical protein
VKTPKEGSIPVFAGSIGHYQRTMFRARKAGGSDAPSWGTSSVLSSLSPSSSSSPLKELSSLLDDLENVVNTSMQTFLDSVASPSSMDDKASSVGRRSGVLDSLKKLRYRTNSKKTGIDDEMTSKSSLHSEDSIAGIDSTATTATTSTTPSSTTSAAVAVAASNNPKTPRSSSAFNFSPKEANARFVPMSSEETAHCVEVIRRISELVVIGESAAATAAVERVKLDSMDRDSSSTEHQPLDGQYSEEYERIRSKIADNEVYASVFEHFFERNGLAMITEILTGAAFDVKSHWEKRMVSLQAEKATKEDGSEDMELCETKLKLMEEINIEDYEGLLLLPPLAIATQGFQSTSILVQNVKRATSLFFILSNNHVNQLINLPLEEYHIAERKKLHQEDGVTTPTFMSPRRFGSPELAELTTTFVSFLKSLALRMNAETLQFFLTYPADTTIEGDTDYFEETEMECEGTGEDEGEDGQSPLDEIDSNANRKAGRERNRPVAVKTIQVEFPLYERALEFCSAHNDSFVRVTAMNICLNTLRLTTVEPKLGEDEPEIGDLDTATGASPDAILHNAKALPMRERLAIAQYVCRPSRVERLASPIFTKLAQLWGVLEEQFRDMELASKASTGGNSLSNNDPPSARQQSVSDKVARARENARREKYTAIFNDTSYNIQDELLLLEDVLCVGLTSLNEQVIEMMFATFVYPLMLQPLLLYFQRSPVSAEVLFADTLNDHSVGRNIKLSDATATERAIISAPAKSALFCLSAAFQFLTNPPLLRLLFTAVFHPLSPDAAGETMIRAKADVACIGPDGKATLRIDRVDENGVVMCDTDRSTYIFGTVTGRKETSGRRDHQCNTETCVFVLAPALSEILEFDGNDGGIVARSRHNPYRRAIFQCFTLSKEVSDLQALSVIAVDSAVSVSAFHEKYVADILFGLDLKRYGDTLPKDEQWKSHLDEPDLDDRGMGGPTAASVESRLSLGIPEGGKVGFDYMNEVITSFKSCLMSAVPGGKGVWRLDYDMVAAHALLSSIRGSADAIDSAYRAVDSRCRQSSSFLADIPMVIDKYAESRIHSAVKDFVQGTTQKDDLYYGAIMDMIFRGNNNFVESKSVINEVLWLKDDLHGKEEDVDIYVPVSLIGSYNDVGSRACSYSPLEQEEAETAFKSAVESRNALLKLDALNALLGNLVLSKGLFRNQKLGGFILKRPRWIVPSQEQKKIFAPVSPPLDNVIFGTDKTVPSYVDTKPGTVLSLVGKIAFPCVCEVPPSSAPLFSEAGAKVVSQGITWQSLYLVIIGHNFVLAEPEKHSSGDGRVVTSCKLEHLVVTKDPDDARMDTSARRLVVVYDSTDLKAPGLFRFEKPPTPRPEGPFVGVQRWRSSLDVWFEDSRAVQFAYNKVTQKIGESKSHRGHLIRRYLAGGDDGSSYDPLSGSK